MAELIPAYEINGVVHYATPAIALAASLNPGDAIKYRRKDGIVRIGIVKFTWMYENVVVKIDDGPDLHVDLDDEILQVMRKEIDDD